MKKLNFLLVCNFKNNVVDEKQFEMIFAENKQKNVIICPNFCDFFKFFNLKIKNDIKLGAQNVCAKLGSQTGEITVDMLKKHHIEYCIVGHSERRKNFAEDSSSIKEKLKILLENNITPILCVGENIAENMTQIEFAKKIVSNQLENELDGIEQEKVIVAYEPIWAIGTGKVADEKHIDEVCGYIKQIANIKTCLYGGSVNVNNFANIAEIDSVDGVLIGKASMDAKNIEIMQGLLKNL